MVFLRKSVRKYWKERFSYFFLFLPFLNSRENIQSNAINYFLSTELKLGQLTTKNVKLGGNTNNGLYLSLVNLRQGPLFLTKVQEESLNQVEIIILNLLEKNGGSEISPRLISAGNLDENKNWFLTTEYLYPPFIIRSNDIAELYSKMDFFSASVKSQLLRLEKVRKRTGHFKNFNEEVLDMICNLHEYKTQVELLEWIKVKLKTNFFQNTSNEMFSIIERFLSEYLHGNDIYSSFGFVHGDFKPDNMMLNNKKELILIDFQHSSFGPRVWDLAFLGSKGRYSFNTYMKEVVLKIIGKNEAYLFSFMYMVANLMYIEVKNKNFILQQRLIPSVNYLKLYLAP